MLSNEQGPQGGGSEESDLGPHAEELWQSHLLGEGMGHFSSSVKF